MSSKGHLALSDAEDLFFGTDDVTAIYYGEIKVWPGPLFDGQLLYLPDED